MSSDWSDLVDAGLVKAMTVELGTLDPGETVVVGLDDRGWRPVMRSDPNPFPRIRLWGRRRG